jgi:hypothetical protein
MNACARSPRDGELPIADVLRRLACYWRVNPLASDTTEGILQWWLGLAPSNADLVERALAMLEAAGIVESVRTPGTQLHYRRVSADAASNERLDGIIAASGSEPHPG